MLIKLFYPWIKYREKHYPPTTIYIYIYIYTHTHTRNLFHHYSINFELCRFINLEEYEGGFNIPEMEEMFQIKRDDLNNELAEGHPLHEYNNLKEVDEDDEHDEGPRPLDSGEQR